ncbi:metalloregulator ArsR/SmtB family transcription factor [Treponema sp. UBA3813]|uniref:ArsR/SmtB family transcription factor n=1 Tax=Treponema sp. UBA3813 TaxID=1947715 RepID=UPI0025E77FFC|nr:metalloregulator ArsR/SmtB family transcription factor [Treponema sp. UBA3813]
MINPQKLLQAQEDFKKCVPIFTALGDTTRQKLCLDLAAAGVEGINVADLSGKTTLSRPAISHHLKVLKDSGIVEPIKKGTQIFYKLKLRDALVPMKTLIEAVEEILDDDKSLT